MHHSKDRTAQPLLYQLWSTHVLNVIINPYIITEWMIIVENKHLLTGHTSGTHKFLNKCCSSQCSTTGATKTGMCNHLWDDAYKRTLAYNQKE